MIRLIDEERQKIIEEQREVLQSLRDLAAELEPEGAHVHHLRKLLAHLDETFLLVVVGEVKSGKSAFINALLGETICAEGPTPLTDRIHILKYGETEHDEMVDEFVLERFVPKESLRNLHIVDTPGTNAIIAEHQQITESFLPKSDLVLFVTSIDRPFTESEYRFLSTIRDNWNKKIIFILSKIDTREEDEIVQVIEYLRETCKAKLNLEPQVFPVSSKLARRGKDQNDESILAASRIRDVEEKILAELGETEKLTLKLEAPTNAALILTQKLHEELKSSLQVLHRDFEFLRDLTGQLERRQADLKERYFKHITLVYDLLQEFEVQGRAFLDKTLTLGQFSVWRDKQRLTQEFERQVIADLKIRLEERLNFAADWLTSENLKTWQSSLDFLERHTSREKYQDRLVGASANEFTYNRDRLYQTVREKMAQEIKRFDAAGECGRISQELTRGLYGFIGVQIGAVALGAVLLTLFQITLLDVSGVALAGVIALTGFAILPSRKAKAIQAFTKNVEELRSKIKGMLQEQFDHEIDVFIENVRSAYEPFRHFFEAESAALEARREMLEVLRKRLFAIKTRLLEAPPIRHT